MKCTNCGQENPEGMKFCSLCGSLMPASSQGNSGREPVRTQVSAESDSAEGIPVSLVDDSCQVWITDDDSFEEFGEWLEDKYDGVDDAKASYDEGDASLSLNGSNWGFCPYDWIVFMGNEPKIYNEEEFHENWELSEGYGNPGVWNCSFNGKPVLYKLTESNIKAVAEKLSSAFSYSSASYSAGSKSINLTYGCNSSVAGAGDYLVVFGEDFRVYGSETKFSKIWKTN